MTSPTLRALRVFLLGFTLAACAGDDDPGDMGPGASTGAAGTGAAPRDDGSATSGAASATTTGVAPGGATGETASANAADVACPLARPAEDTGCAVTAPLCTYDEIECTCDAGAWSCEEPVHPDCPPTTPANASACSLPEATECDYLEQECECLSGLWECASEDDERQGDGGLPDASTGDDGGAEAPIDAGDAPLSCPELRPSESTSCEPSARMCTYESTECTCPSGTWSCSEPVRGCPASPPLHGDPCTGLADCDFLEVECECTFGSWRCKEND